MNSYDFNYILVFGSNLQGIHGRGAAEYAKKYYDAEQGIGKGPTGRAYAIPTKETPYKTLPLEKIKKHIDEFIKYAKDNPNTNFLITAVGTGLAEYSVNTIAPLFKDAPDNCIFYDDWNK